MQQSRDSATQLCHPVCRGRCPPCKHLTPTETRFAPRFTPVRHNNLLLRVFSTISKGSAHLQIKTPTGTALLCPGCGWNMTPVPHSDLPAHFHGAGTALLGLAPSTLSPQRSLLLWGLLGRSGEKRSRHHPEHIPPHTPSCSTSLEGIPLGAGCPAPAKGH